MTWILIVIMYGHKVEMHEFNTEPACRKAIAEIAVATRPIHAPATICVPKGEQP